MNDKPEILIIGDDKPLCEGLRDSLKSEGFLTETTHNTEDGIKKIKDSSFNIVLLDMKAPDMEGVNALEKIRNISPYTEVIVFSEYAEAKNVIEAITGNAFFFLFKPFEMSNLTATIKRVQKKQTLLLDNFKLPRQIEDAKRDWESTFDSIPDPISIHDTDFNIIRCNKAFSDKLNVKLEDIIGKKCYEVFHSRNEPWPTCPFVRCKESLKSEREEEDCMGRIFSMSCFPKFDKSGKLNGIVHIARDVTESKQTEEKLRISDKMASLGRLTAGIYHEVLNPVNIISSHVQLLLMKAEKGSQTEKDLKSILEETKRIAKISDGLLGFSRKVEGINEEVDVNSLLEKVLSILEPDMRLKNIGFLKRFEDGLPGIKANSDKLRQVFLNMITNARDAMPEGGTLTISTQVIQNEEYSFVRIRFKDTGCGIAKENRDRIFKQFFTTKKEGKGTGLGLSTSYEIIENHGGTMSLESEEGKGTTFTIYLPEGIGGE